MGPALCTMERAFYLLGEEEEEDFSFSLLRELHSSPGQQIGTEFFWLSRQFSILSLSLLSLDIHLELHGEGEVMMTYLLCTQIRFSIFRSLDDGNCTSLAALIWRRKVALNFAVNGTHHSILVSPFFASFFQDGGRQQGRWALRGKREQCCQMDRVKRYHVLVKKDTNST